MKNNRGIALPIVAVLSALLGLAVIAWLPSEAGLSAQKLRYKHMTWWHWQQAVIQYYRVRGQWPDDLVDVRNEFGLQSEPSFIDGFRIPEGFRVRLTEVTIDEKKTLARGLVPYVTGNQAATLDVDLSPMSDTAIPPSLIARFINTSITTALDMNNYNINNVGQIGINDELIVNAGTRVGAVETHTLQTARIDYPQALVTDSFHSNTQLNAIDELTNKIKVLYVQLDQYMTSQEGIANHLHLNIDAVDCASRGCSQRAAVQGVSPL
ncbi:hypothetical protein [Pseudidiomarina woesei]|uniref:Uncharacterized protein n=1 Tax=Pseudidiomarina woesei TaxID=1381080 RepID=A0A0K6HCA1_9GAMM|nr:hypothetical protein [Pseudidiomarina woesei]CUA88411.1 hypothetical protein Ga0061064_2175 [Pseudidiomarina woesei]